MAVGSPFAKPGIEIGSAAERAHGEAERGTLRRARN
jgi:hypothetical protein